MLLFLPIASSEDSTTAVVVASSEDSTTAVVVASSEDSTTAVVVASSEDSTTAVVVASSEDSTTAVVASSTTATTAPKRGCLLCVSLSNVWKIKRNHCFAQNYFRKTEQIIIEAEYRLGQLQYHGGPILARRIGK